MIRGYRWWSLSSSLRRWSWSVSLAMVVFSGNVSTCSAGNMSLPGSFAVSPTGAATYSIPIALPPGTAGVDPSLSLDYNSNVGNGLLGIGWSLSGLPSITRCSRTMAQDGAVSGVNYDANDRFCMDGQRLVAISGAYGADGTQYRTEVDTFSKIISHSSAGSGPAWFEVHTKSGQTMEFGNTIDSRVLAQGRASARVWSVNKVSDSKSNYFSVTYTNDAANGQYYPSRIDYTGNVAGTLAPYNSVQFVYATRPDIVPQYQAASATQLTVRLTDVKTYAGTSLVSDYRLAYQQSGAANRSRVTSVTACDASGNCLPSTTIAWTNPTSSFPARNQWSNSFGATSWSAFPRMLADVNGDGLLDIVGFASDGVRVALNTGTSFATDQVWNNGYGAASWPDQNTSPRMLADVNGDGLPDIVGFASDGVRVSLNTGTSFGSAQVWSNNFGAANWTDQNTYPRMLVDANGDGLPDVVGFSSSGVQVALNTGTSFATAQVWNAGFAAGSWPNQTSYTRMLVDVNGDGLPDVVGFASSGVLVALNTGTSFASAQLWTANFSVASWPDQNTYPRILADVNGDGLQDIVGFGSSGVQVALNTGTSFASGQIWNTGFAAGSWPDQNTYPRILADVNGDGLPDIIGFASDGARVSLNTGTSFASPQLWNTGYNVASWTDQNTYPRMMADLLGTGYQGILGFSSSGVIVSTNSASSPLDLVSSITSGLGATTTISYVPSTSTSTVTKGTGTVFPMMDLMLPLYVVSRVDASNAIGGTYSSSYTYSGGRIDIRGRGFLGFAQTSVKDLQTSITDTTTYRQDFPYNGLVASATRALNSQTLGQSTNTYQFANASGGTTISPSSAPYRVSLSQNVSSGADLDGSALPTVTTANQYDTYNNATQVAVSTPDGFSKTTTNTFTNDATNWYLGRLTRASVANVAP